MPLNALALGDGDNDYRLEIYTVGNNGHVYQFKAMSAAPTPVPGTATQTPIPDADKALKILHSQINPAHGEQARVRWYQADNASVTLVVYNLLGDKVAILAENRAFAPGQLQEVTWNGKTSRGALAGSGIYIVYLRSGSTKAWAKVAVIK